MNNSEKSDTPVVLTRSPNKDSNHLYAEAAEGRGVAKGNMGEQNVPRTQSRTSTLSALARVRQAAIRDKGLKFTALFHHITRDALRSAYRLLKRQAAAGVDGVTWMQYGMALDENIAELHARLQRGAYRAKPSRRVYIPKADGKQRPLGVAALEDKIVQRAAVEVLNAVYESDFVGFSYGFRPGRSQHQALDALATAILRKKVNWVFDADVRGFFDAIDHGWMVRFLEHRIADRRLLRLIQKWLSAGVLENGKHINVEQGTPQGATVSPLLANVYLHYVFDLWIQQWRKRHAKGDVVTVRFADDFIVGFQRVEDAQQFRVALANRLRQFKLELHPEKTRLIRFGRYAAKERQQRGEGKPETFDFLGFTHVCARARAGGFLLVRRTRAKRMRAKLHELRDELRKRRHLPVPEQGGWLGSVLRGYFAYHAVPTNIGRLAAFRDQVVWHWRRSLRRRSQRTTINWQRIQRHASRWLPKPRVLHPWPEERFDAMTRGRSRVR